MSLAPLTPLEAHIAGTMPKVSRSLSMSSSLSSSSTSSTFSRSADDMLDRLVNQLTNSTFHLWSAGNVRLNNRDLTVPPAEAADLIESIKRDERFEIVSVTYLDVEGGEDWKLCVRRNHIVSPLSTPSLSDAE